MQQPPSILVYGADPGLLQSRTWVFQSAGFATVSAPDLQSAQALVHKSPIDLLVLCHTLSDEDTRAALAWARTLPTMKRIVLTAGVMHRSELAGEEVLSQFAGARDLVASVHRLLPSLQTA